MTLPTGISRRALLMKLGILFNSIVAVILAVRSCDTFSLRSVAGERTVMTPGFLSAISINFLPGKRAWRLIETQ